MRGYFFILRFIRCCFQDAKDSKDVVDTTLKAINLVSEAIQKKRVAKEGETVVRTKAFYMNLRRTRKNAFNTSVYTVAEASDVRVSLPSPNVVVEDLSGDGPIDVQVNIYHQILLSINACRGYQVFLLNSSFLFPLLSSIPQ